MNAWDDPNVKQALRDGRRPDEISLLQCPECDAYGYYNDGSHFTCRKCDYTATDEDLSELAMEGITLEDFTDMQMQEDGYP